MLTGTPLEAWATAGLRVAKVPNGKPRYHCQFLLIHPAGRSKDGLYEPALADSEREAVADLLQYLENVRTAKMTGRNSALINATARGDRLLHWRASSVIKHLGIL